MKIDVDGERSRQRLPLARKLLRKCRNADIEQKAVTVDGFRISVKPGAEETEDSVRVTAPVGAIAAGTLPTKVRWVVAEHIWGAAVAHDMLVEYRLVGGAVADDTRTPTLQDYQHQREYLSDYTQGEQRHNVAVDPVANEVVRATYSAVGQSVYNQDPAVAGLYAVTARMHAYGTPTELPESVDGTGLYAALKICGSHWTPASNGPGAVVTLHWALPARSTQTDVWTSNDAMYWRVYASPGKLDHTARLAYSDVRHLVFRDPGFSWDDAQGFDLYVAGVTTPVDGYAPTTIEVTLWIVCHYGLDSAGPKTDALSAVATYDVATATWSIPQDTAVYSEDGEPVGLTGYSFQRILAAPFNHDYHRLTFHDPVHGPVTYGARQPGQAIEAYRWRDQILPDSLGIVSFDAALKQGNPSLWTLPVGLMDSWVRPDYVCGRLRWCLIYRQFAAVDSRRSWVHSVHLGTPWTSWETLPLPEGTTYAIQPTVMDPEDVDAELQVEMLAVAQAPDDELRFWVYRNSWAEGWRPAATITDPEVVLDPANIQWSIALYGMDVTSRRLQATGGCHPLLQPPLYVP